MRRYEFIHGFIESELDYFEEHFDAMPFPREQQLRDISFAWLSDNFESLISATARSRIEKLVDGCLRNKDYEVDRWWRIPGLLAACYVLTGDRYYRDMLVPNLCHGNSNLRRGVLDVAAVVVRRLEFDQLLTQTTERNMEYRHFWWEEHLLLTLVSIGEKQSKRQWLNELEKRFPEQMEKFIGDLGTYLYRDGYFCGVFSEVKSFLLSRMLSDVGILREEIFQQQLPESEIDADQRWRYIDSHPLDKSIINLEFLRKTPVTA